VAGAFLNPKTNTSRNLPLGKQPSLLDPLDGGQANSLQRVHWPATLIFGRTRTAMDPPVHRFDKGVGSEPARPFPRFKPPVLIRDKVAQTY
jgi:hypothetical protein